MKGTSTSLAAWFRESLLTMVASIRGAINTCRGPLISNLDASLQKHMVLTESVRLQLSMDLFNALNSQGTLTPTSEGISSRGSSYGGFGFRPRQLQVTARPEVVSQFGKCLLSHIVISDNRGERRARLKGAPMELPLAVAAATRSSLVGALLRTAFSAHRQAAVTFLRGLSCSELECLAEFEGACVLEGMEGLSAQAPGPVNPYRFLEDFFVPSVSERWCNSADRAHKTFLVLAWLEYSLRTSQKTSPVSVRSSL